MDVNAIDLTGCPDDLIAEAERAAADNVKRVHRAGPAEQHLSEITAFVEFKTVWHPMGA
jgi:hypothetical protein